MNKTISELLTTSYTSENPDEVYDCLVELQPNKLSTNQLEVLVRHIENICLTKKFDYEHYNTIGTGGDKIKTINISSIAAIIASKYLNVIKLGARGITSKWGSKDFNSIINSKIDTRHFNSYFHNDKSRFLSFGELGISYGDTLVGARRRINQEGLLDIYKVIFPFANVTNCTAQVNGVSNEQYLAIFADLSLAFNRHCIIVHSLHGVDELMPGKNIYLISKNGKIVERSLDLESTDFTFLIENENPDILFSKFEEILAGRAPNSVMNTIYYNVTAIINLKEEHISFQDIFTKYFCS